MTSNMGLRSALAPAELVTDEQTLAAFGADAWPISRKWDAREQESHRPAAVIRVTAIAEVPDVLRWAAGRSLSVVPVGARSGVTGACVPIAPGLLALDLSQLDRILSFDPATGYVTVEAGVKGDVLEAYLNERGFTLGHYPQSLAISSVGGWIGTLSTGTYSAKYGGIERLMRGCDVVLADGTEVSIAPKPRAAAGPWLPAIFLGAEGTLGIVTRATLQARSIPVSRTFRGYAVPSIGQGLALVREAFRLHAEPPLIRLYDAVEAHHLYDRVGIDRAEPLLIVGHEGHPQMVAAAEALLADLAARAGAVDLGTEIGESWERGRYRAEWLERGNAAANSIADSIEVTGGWATLEPIYNDVTESIRPLCKTAMAHWSHFYPDGCGMYVIFQIEEAQPEALRATYDRVWNAVLDGAARYGGTLSHHHGIGLVRAERFPAALGSAFPLLERVKSALDPQGRLNPGKLGLAQGTR